ncbi:hypothetical protein MIND_01394300 [Mycena indigotica]|uniref:lytic cellulose monooxygenase (C4-dehydrogenating) n=1 Tax=Mycena indigotica TaxID=2126181 RepID=A0A8H6RXV4_9AGAR|nr:uncharacterized protein MIND_01394300 [Mycena indigotica]KAF7289324.1 hypothetical protein MIND_01394300 [Mycena indigotica]
MQSIVAAALVLVTAPLVVGHGQVNRVTAGSNSNKGPNQYWSGDAANGKTVTRLMYKSSAPAYVLFGDFDKNSKMSCEASSKAPAPKTLKVSAGESITVYWEGATPELKGKGGTGGLTAYNPWVHAMGFVFDYITSCKGDCTSFDATNAGWTKIAHAGLDMSQTISSSLRQTMKGKPEAYFPKSGPGLWGMAKLVQDGSKWTIRVPPSLKNGQYMIRHELAAVHNPKTSNPTSGPQLYIACIQLEVVNGGQTSLPEGTQAGKLYLTNGAFANTDVYNGAFNPNNVKIPGPAVWDGATAGKRDTIPISNSTLEVEERNAITKRDAAARRAHMAARSH